MPQMKTINRKLHLWVGMGFGAIFLLLGLTGSALAWMHQLDGALNPGLLHVAPPPHMVAGTMFRLDPAVVDAAHDRLARDPKYGKPSQLVLPERAGDVFVASYRPAPVAEKSLFAMDSTRQVMLDPYTLAVTGERNWGELGLSAPLLMPTLFHLHRYLVAGDGGKTLIATAGLAMMFIAASGMVLWWPKPTRDALWKSITVRHGGSWPRFNFRMHRAAGFFCMPVLLVLGFSGTYFNMPGWVLPAVTAVATVTPAAKASNLSGMSDVAISPGKAMRAAQERYPLARVSRVAMPAKAGAPYEVRLRQAGELRKGDGATRVSIDSGDGRVVRVVDPLEAQGGDLFLSWQFPLHTGEAFGTGGRVFVSLFGIAPLGFFVTGLAIWLKRRSTRSKARVRARA